MERLTNHFDYCDFVECRWRNAELEKVNQCDFFNMTSRDKCHDKAIYEKLREYEDAEEQGLLLRLPCKMGDTLYDIQEFIDGCYHPEVYVIDASAITVSKDELGMQYCIDCVDYREKHFGTILFSSMEDAEKALVERGKE